MEMQTDRHDAWHPGINSRIPARLMPLVTLFRPENADVGYDEARELSDFSGLPPAEFVSFRPERLAQHEILIRVTADLSVPDGPSYEELGINLRDMVKTIFDHYIVPDMAIVQRAHDDMRAKALRIIDRELASKLFERSPTPKPARPGGTGFLTRLFGRQPQDPDRKTPPDHPETAVADLWQRQLAVTEDALEAACLESLVRIVGGIIGHRGRIIPDRELLARLVANHVCSHHGGEVIAEAIRPLVDRAIAERNYRVLPVQQKPTVMNVKGASASGKSTVRPRQRRLAEKLGIPWEDFALISPDYWRKYLLDYETLGEDYKYAAMLTGEELEIIDRKLDLFMARKGARGEMSHLLIDRFRFDSFVVEDDHGADSRLLTRFGDQVFMFFMVTPPQETIERAWQRGLATGRYKAVDDLLYHNVEAYTGMPGLFFSWVRSKVKRVHFEFLDNDVPKGELPKTAAFGWNDTMTILDPELMIDIDRYRKVNVQATEPGGIFHNRDMDAALNVGFLKNCVEQIPEIRFADPSSGRVLARIVRGRLLWCDHHHIEAQPPHSCLRTALEAIGYETGTGTTDTDAAPDPIDIDREMHFTLGRWTSTGMAASQHW
ncbi:MAG: hypothetical protein R3C70_03855 [Geminicoccaceae bacterium]